MKKYFFYSYYAKKGNENIMGNCIMIDEMGMFDLQKANNMGYDHCVVMSFQEISEQQYMYIKLGEDAYRALYYDED